MAVEALGSGEYEVYFKTRGGERFLCRARDMLSLTWSRKLNNVSSASVTIALNSLDSECCACVSQVNPWQHEMGVYRNGVEVWVGPITNGKIDLASMTAKYDALDLMAWFDHRWIELKDNDVEFEEADISEVFEWLIGHAYYRAPWNMSWNVPRIKIPIDRTYTCAEPDERWSGSFQNIGDELRALAESGVDFTTIGRNFITGDLEQSSTPSMILTDEHWSTLPTIEIVGGQMATEVGVGGGNGGYYGWYDDQIWIERADSDDYGDQFGLLQSFYNAADLDEEETTKLPNAIAQQAYSLRELKKQPFVYITGGRLSPKTPIDINSVTPGDVYRVALSETCRTIESDYRLFGVTVSFGTGGEGVELELTPLGADEVLS